MQAAETEKTPRRSKAVAVQAPVDTSMAAMIAKVAAQPVVDVKALHELLSLQERVDAAAAKRAFLAAFNECQKAMGPIAKTASNPDTKSKYATHAKLDEAMRPIYTAHGFTIFHNTGAGDGSPIPPDSVRVLQTLAHVGGHERHSQIDMPADGKGAKGGAFMSRTHATASAFSYGRRYLQGAGFNIVFFGEDDDGNKAGKTLPKDLPPDADEPISEAQLDELIAVADGVGANKERFCEWAGIEGLNQIRRRDFETAKRRLLAKRKTVAA